LGIDYGRRSAAKRNGAEGKINVAIEYYYSEVGPRRKNFLALFKKNPLPVLKKRSSLAGC